MEIQAQDLHHYGIISGICNEIELVDQINKLAGSNPQRKVSIGECTKAMIINGMGYTTRPLYLAHQFYETKPLCHLIKPDVDSSDFNDDALGRTLDALYEKGCTTIFSHIAMNAAKQYGVDLKFRHFDTTNMQVYGEYADQDQATQLINFGYAKHDRVDLKQFLISLMVSNDGGVPLLQYTVPGNTSDNAHFREVLKTMQHNIIGNEDPFYAVIDAAFYCEESIQLGILWITRVPDKIKLVGDLKNQFINRDHMEIIDDNYMFSEVCTWYGEVKQRWLIVYSKMAHERAKNSIMRQIKKEREEAEKALKKLHSNEYACAEDAQKTITALSKKLSYHDVKIEAINERQSFVRAGRPTKESPLKISYCIETTLHEKSEENEQKILLKSMFVLATNELDYSKLSNKEILSYYKDQHKVESGFRFLKDPLCLASSVYLKKTERIVALSMIMCLCLLVYSLAERKLRMALKQANETVPNQIGKGTQTPTMRWVFQMFEGVIIAYIPTSKGIKQQIINLSEKLKKILRLLGNHCMIMYLVEPQTQ